MADTTYSVKLSDEMQERIKQLVEVSGVSNKEFITSLINNFELEQTKLNTPTLASDITEIQQLTSRINNIFTGVGERINTLKDTHSRELSKKTATNQDTIQLLQQRIKTLELDRFEDEERIKEFIKNKETSEQKVLEIQEKVSQLENTIKDKVELIKEYRQKNDTLNGIILEYKEASTENKKLKSTLTTLTQQTSEQAQALENEQLKVKELEQKIKKLNELHSKDIETLKKENQLNIQAALFELREKHNKEVDTLRLEYGNRIAELLKLEIKQPEQEQIPVKKTISRTKKVNHNTIEKSIE